MRADRAADPPPADVWPMTVPAVAQLWAEGLDLAPGTTVLVGENASGKSTLVEVLAAALGLNPQGGSSGSRMAVRRTEPEALPLVVERSPGAPRWSYLLRDETLHGLYSYLEDNRDPFAPPREPSFHAFSHGEAFLSIFEDRLRGPGVYLLDEPDAALSFAGQLRLVAGLLQLADQGAQLVVATHSPLVAALPGARILEVGPWGLRPTRWDELELTANWRQFLDHPEAFLRHLR
ncbi:AAA family ATPase [Klenkia sp. PcliD-1-E]|uniref:AAA family ATPase n=1 Tax=Klenkia sp. PcliD-1-E TaxID=2954492 RepID=UPI0020974717|nr:AAA family ATPase [Klenkia sp. PcliD-1-E]MCO7219662.1 AAA family ATPase [Klenkia sp. PcliD-1-E]